MNIGLRYVFPVYPFLFLAIGLAAARLHAAWPGATYGAGWILAIALAAETFATHPNYIAHFNPIAEKLGGGAINLLGDSNLDWGQDLKLLADWRRGHQDVRMYLVYFGLVDPEAYGISYISLPGDRAQDFAPQLDSGVIAISATHLQGIYLDDEKRKLYAPLRSARPIAVLGKSIYLYNWPPTQQQ